ncbi:class I SAM-dependent methyltransferase [Sphingomonas lycopersici]|uniref:Class I SAM-dependent methyltransferase n=1 Tax=Sphingomonas lycopersici TaxID=2951807 RepID=A0AA41ZH15_9SPHN|nr:class I SAM-dependent methyltransferase [Sphingomonas lycopersici]MCW6536486.1 class I SAM-dependent methyltransferase [Sphingomonas lycopersici]
MKVRDLQHAMLPETSVEQRSRQEAVVALRRLLNTRVRPRNVEAFASEAQPAFIAAHGRAPQSPEEVQQAYLLSPSYRRWSAANRAAQEMIWVSVGEPIYRDLDRMRAAARALTTAPDRKGSLNLDPNYDPSAEVADVDIHLQPGGYAMDRGEDDVIAGALYECGGNVFSFGQGIGRADSKAGVVIRLLDEHFGGFRPLRILDIGCSAGAASAAYAAHYPDAEVHAVDIGAAMLRYAHARAESLGVGVHFHQMDASAMTFEDGSFDLVVSHNLMHEIGEAKRRAMMREARRLVRPGGVVIHQDVAIRDQPTIVHQVERDWDTHFNGEVHWSTYATADLRGDMRAAGFAVDEIVEHDLAAVQGFAGNRWYAISARKPA